ncbi:MAG TPA: Rid family detoxifying hydrolase [Gemmatimonadaceae bacterium]|nr:Rid family detoxifying hydrolase [Gemmatimonadaceae bacterium]
MPRTVILTQHAPAPGGPYSQAIASGNILAISGQVGIDPATGAAPAGVVAQARQALANLDAILRAAGASREDVIKTTCLLTDINDFPVFNDEYRTFFGEHRPARSTFGVQLFGGYVVEVEALAVIPS